MDSSSETETIVEESVKLCDSPSILTGLFQIRYASSETRPFNDDNPEMSQNLAAQDKEGVRPTTSHVLPLDTESYSQRDDTSMQSLSQQSDKSLSIFTQRVPEKRKPLVPLPNSPVFAQAPATKLPRSTDYTSDSSDTHLSVQSQYSGFPAAPNETASTSLGITVPNTQTQSSDTAFPSLQDSTQEPNQPLVPVSQSPTMPTHLSAATPDGASLETNQPEKMCRSLEPESFHMEKISVLQEAKHPPLPALIQRWTMPTVPVPTSTSLGSAQPSPAHQVTKHPSLANLNQNWTTSTTPLPTRSSLGSAQPSPDHPSPENQPASIKTSDGLASRTMAHQEQNLGNEDDESLIEMERMQVDIRGMMSSRDKSVKYADQIKKSLKDMQVKLRHLSARQRQHRYQLSIRLKQQATTSNSNGQSQQQQEARTQLQLMTKRQQRLLKLLQSHKELATAFQQKNHAECDASQQNQTSGQSYKDSLQEVQHLSYIMQKSSGDSNPMKKSSLPSEAPIPNISNHKEVSLAPSSSSAQTISQPQRIIPTGKVFQTPTADTSVKMFKPPFKAKQTKRPQVIPPRSTSNSADPSNKDPKLGLDEAQIGSKAAIPENSQSSTGVIPVATESSSGRNSLQCPFSPSSPISVVRSTSSPVPGIKDSGRSPPQTPPSSRYTAAPMEFQTPTSSINIPSRTSILPASTDISTSDPQVQPPTLKTQSSDALSRNQTFHLQGATKACTLLSTQAVTTVVDSSSSKTPVCSILEASGEDNIPTLLDLLQRSLVEPGENVLSIKLKKRTVSVTASINPDGTVSSTSSELKNFTRGSLCHMLSALKHKSVNAIRKNPSTWKSVFYKGKSLDKLQREYRALMMRDLRWQSQSNAKGLSPAIHVTVNTTRMDTHPRNPTPNPLRHSPDSAHPPPSNPSQHKLASSVVHNLASSKGCDLVSGGHDPTSSVGHGIHSLSTCSLASSLERVLLISDDELMPAGWGVSPNFWSAEDIQDASITPEWIQEMDVWT